MVAEIDAEVVEIERRSVKVRDTDGLWELNLGESVRNRILLEATDAATGESAAEVIETEAPTGQDKPADVGDVADGSSADALSDVSGISTPDADDDQGVSAEEG